MLGKIIAFLMVLMIPVGVIFLVRRRKKIIKDYIIKNNWQLIKVSIIQSRSPWKNLSFIFDGRVFEIEYKDENGSLKKFYGYYSPLSANGFIFYKKLEEIPSSF